jgi:hypothetical protein
MEELIARYIEDNEEELYERYSAMYPEEIHSDWILGEHLDEVTQFVETYLEDEVQLYMIKNRVFVMPEHAQLYNNLLRNETYIGESHDTLTMESSYMGKKHTVTAIRYHDIFVVVSIYNHEDHIELVY